MQRKSETENNPNVEREEWNNKDLGKESVNQTNEETLRQILRGDEQKGNPNERDVTGYASINETPQGREEAKHDTNEERGK